MAAGAIDWAAHHGRGEVYVGIPTVYAIWGNKLAPWPAGRYLAKTAVSSQLSPADKRRDRPDNLFEPPPGDPGAHGPYDDRAHAHSVQLAATKRRRTLLGAAAGAALLGGAAIARGL